jgi:lipopolysaccharide export system protein LptA
MERVVSGRWTTRWTWMMPLALLSLIIQMVPTVGGAAEPAAQDAPVQVTADRMVSETRTDQIMFSGNVEIRRSDLYVKSDRLEVRQNRDTKQVSQMVASGSVFIRHGERAATAERATFFEREQKVVLTGNPHAWEGTTEVWGDEMVFLLGEGSMIVTGGAERMRMQLLPGGEGDKLPTAKAKGRGQ